MVYKEGFEVTNQTIGYTMGRVYDGTIFSAYPAAKDGSLESRLCVLNVVGVVSI